MNIHKYPYIKLITAVDSRGHFMERDDVMYRSGDPDYLINMVNNDSTILTDDGTYRLCQEKIFDRISNYKAMYLYGLTNNCKYLENFWIKTPDSPDISKLFIPKSGFMYGINEYRGNVMLDYLYLNQCHEVLWFCNIRNWSGFVPYCSEAVITQYDTINPLELRNVYSYMDYRWKLVQTTSKFDNDTGCIMKEHRFIHRNAKRNWRDYLRHRRFSILEGDE